MVAGIEGIRKKKIMMKPCIVKTRLYMSPVITSARGVNSSRRMSMADATQHKKY